MTDQRHRIFEFGPFRVDAVERTLERDGRVVALTPKAFDVLLVLVEHDGRVVTKDDLMSAVWPDSFVEEGNLTTAVYTLRKTLGEFGRFVETVPRRGYRFVGGARTIEPEEPAPAVVDLESFADVPVIARAGDVVEDEGPVVAPSRPSRRWQAWIAAAAVLLAFVAIVASTWPPRKPQNLPRSLAVLPFKPIGNQSEDDHMGLGMADAIIGRLANIRQVLVRPTSAIRKFENGQEDAVAAGRELGVDLVVDGSMQRADDRIRVSVQLVRTSDGTAIWNKSFDEKFTEIFAVQDSISEQIAGALPIELTADERSLLAKSHSEDAETYRLYLKGYYFWSSPNDNATEEATKYFEAAVARDPTFALGHSGLAGTYWTRGFLGLDPPTEAWPKCEAEARKAIELDDSLSEAHTALAASLAFYHWDLQAAERESARAVALDPAYTYARNVHAHCLMYLGRTDEAVAEQSRISEINPTQYDALVTAGTTFMFARRYDEALASLEQLRTAYPNDDTAYLLIGRVYAKRGQEDAAVAEWRAGFVASGQTRRLEILDRADAASGYAGVVRALALDRLDDLETRRKSHYVPAMDLADVYVELGDADNAFLWLDRAIDERCAWVVDLPLSPTYDPIRSDPRFAALVARIVPG